MRWLLLASILCAGCALDRSGLGPEGEPLDGGAGELDGDFREGRCLSDSHCAAGRVCSLGTCIDPDADADRDGVPTDVDCDDDDASVGSTAQRPCDGPCGPGVEHCSDGTWRPCDAPAECTCMTGQTRTLVCAMCGTQMQDCGPTNEWQNVGACAGTGPCSPGAVDTTTTPCGDCGVERVTCEPDCRWGIAVCVGEGECAPDTMESESQACGRCMSGTQTRERVCEPACSWTPFSDWGACTGETGCDPGTMETETQSCGSCGVQTRTRTCGASCAFDPWSDWGTCTMTGCVPGTTESRTVICGRCDNGSLAQSRQCNAMCVFDPWMTAAGATCEDETYCINRHGNAICPRRVGTIDCRGGYRWCQCSWSGSWTSCGRCWD